MKLLDPGTIGSQRCPQRVPHSHEDNRGLRSSGEIFLELVSQPCRYSSATAIWTGVHSECAARRTALASIVAC